MSSLRSTDHRPALSYDLGTDKCVLTAATSKIEHIIATADPSRGITAAVITLNDISGDHFQQRRIESNRCAQTGLLLMSGCSITGFNGLGLIKRRTTTLFSH